MSSSNIDFYLWLLILMVMSTNRSESLAAASKTPPQTITDAGFCPRNTVFFARGMPTRSLPITRYVWLLWMGWTVKNLSSIQHTGRAASQDSQQILLLSSLLSRMALKMRWSLVFLLTTVLRSFRIILVIVWSLIPVSFAMRRGCGKCCVGWP